MSCPTTLKNTDVPSSESDDGRVEGTPASERNALACGPSGTLRVTAAEVLYIAPASECHTLASGSPASECYAPASGDSYEAIASGVTLTPHAVSSEVPEPHRHQRRSLFCGSRAMGGINFDGSPISESGEEPGCAIEYHEVWDHEDVPLEHQTVDQSELPPGYRFASELSR